MAFGDITYPFKRMEGKLLVKGPQLIEAGDYQSYGEFKRTVKELFQDDKNFYLRPGERKYKYSPYDRLVQLRSLAAIEEETNDAIEGIVNNFLDFRIKNQASLLGAPSFQFDVQGQTVDFGRLLAGDPECMIDFFGAYAGEHRQLDINIGLCSPAFLFEKNRSDSDRLLIIFIHFLPILELIDEWESKGIRCRVKAKFRNGPAVPSKKLEVDQFVGSVLIKDYSDILDNELFCRVFMSDEAIKLNYMINIMLTNPYPGKGSIFSALDALWMQELCDYNPARPNEVNFPSIWLSRRIKFARISGRNLLELFNYPTF